MWVIGKGCYQLLMSVDKKVKEYPNLVEIPYEVSVPKYVKKELPDYVLVKEEITYKVPRIQYEDKTYERPQYVEKIYEIPRYVEKVYEKPVYIEKVYEVPIIKYVDKIINVEKLNIIEKEKVRVVEVPHNVDVPNYVRHNVVVNNAVIKDREVTNAIIKDVSVEVIHPKYLCRKCKDTIFIGDDDE